VLSAGVVFLALGSGFFAATRTIVSTLPYKNGSRLALVSRTGRLEAIRRGIPANLASLWLRDSKLMEAMAECSFTRLAGAAIGQRAFEVSSLQATGNLLDVIGEPVPPEVQKRIAADEPVALLSYTFWQRELNSDPKVVGRRLQWHRQSFLIAGVLPADFWFVSPSIQVYALGGEAVGGQSMLLVRAKPDVSARQLEAELSEIAERNDIPFTQTAPHVLFLTDALHTPIWLFGGSLLIAAVVVGIGHGSRLRRSDRADARLPFGNWQWWTFLLLKTAAALTLVFVAGVEIFIGFSHQFTTEPLGGPALLWFYTAGCSLVLLAVIADQQARCRVCLQCLAFPVRVGCPGCLFLDWSGTELLCPDGHGVLYVPHHVSCWDEAERWVALEI